MKFFSEYGEDQWIYKNLAHRVPSAGVYVDVGCAHPVQYSNTAWLRENEGLRWEGLAVDGNPGYRPHWLPIARAHFAAVAIGTQTENKFWVEANAACSRIITPAEHAAAVQRFGHDQANDVPVVTLQSLLDHHQVGKIDYLSLDCEGGEFDVLNSFGLERHAPTIIMAEYNTQGIGEDLRVHERLFGSGQYDVVYKTVANFVFVRKET